MVGLSKKLPITIQQLETIDFPVRLLIMREIAATVCLLVLTRMRIAYRSKENKIGAYSLHGKCHGRRRLHRLPPPAPRLGAQRLLMSYLSDYGI